jgi:RNA polymerase-binding protein DksA
LCIISKTRVRIIAICTGGWQRGQELQALTAKDLKQIKALLQSKINELMAEAGKTVIDMAGQEEKLPDLNDRASQESELNLEIRMRERERKLILKMREAIERIDSGLYGVCEGVRRAHRGQAPHGQARDHVLHRVQDPRGKAAEDAGKDAGAGTRLLWGLETRDAGLGYRDHKRR